MEFTPLTLSAITNIVLASEAFFVSGLFFARNKKRYSAAWYWQFVLLALATAALLGGIDHGFFEVFGQTPERTLVQRLDWLVIGVLTLFAFRTTTSQFLKPPWRAYLDILAVIQFLVFCVLVIFVDNFLIVMLNYAPVMILLLVFSLLGLRDGSGSWPMIVGIVLAFAASGLQVARVDVFSPFDHDSLYHFGTMVAVIFLYLGGKRLKTTLS